MGLVSLPVTIFLYWLMLRYKKEVPFPKSGVVRLLIAGAVSALLAYLLYNPVHHIASLFTDMAGGEETFLWNLISMFCTAGLIEEGLKYLTCRLAMMKKGMVRTWMDCVIAFASVGITFGFVENIVYGMRSGLAVVLARAVAPGHFLFGILMGYLYGKYRATGKKKYHVLCYVLPVIFHTITNAFLQSVSFGRVYLIMGMITALGFAVAAVVTVCKVISWKKNKTLDIVIIASDGGSEEIPAQAE